MIGQDDIFYKKTRIRAQIREQRRLLSPEDLSRAQSELLTAFKDALKDDAYFKSVFTGARNIALYESARNELPCDALADYIRKEGKSTLYPRTSGKDMEFCIITDPAKELFPGNFGILEPRPGMPSVKGEDIDIVIMPGIAFDEDGGRVGQGGGFYDRWISSIPEDKRPLLIGVCMSFQMMTKVPSNSSDIPADVVLCV
ncbi:MAG: 5-formyltetrahydrofolate cyclo-ligase [Clostridiales bacterium]|nr:5-formyltetrahydrofolate cyclo-ligase [Clostridiales bacterium]